MGYKVGDRVEKMSTHSFYKIIEMNSDGKGKVKLQRLVNGSKSDNIIEVDDLNSFKLVKPIEDTISYFDDNFDFLSNLFMTPVEYDGVIYPSAEHAFQASKVSSEDEREKIRNLSSSMKAKVIGKTLKPEKEWEDDKYNKMYCICLNKFKNNDELKNQLISTKSLNLVNGGEDSYWGVNKDSGENNLGKILMQIRKELLTEI